MSDINSPPVKKPQVGIGFLIFCAIISGARAMDVKPWFAIALWSGICTWCCMELGERLKK